MKFDILNRYSGEVQLSAEIDCSVDAPPSLKLGLAVKWAVKERANLRQDGLLVIAGCRRFAPAKAVEHWTQARGETQLGNESLQLVEHMMTLAKIRGWSI